MSENESGRKPVTRDEIIYRLQTDPEYLESMVSGDAEFNEARKRNREAAAPLVADLAQAGYPVNSADQLRHSIRTGCIYRSAIPILLHWLPRMDNVDVREGIVRALSVPWAKPAATPALIEEFRNPPPDSNGSYRWAVGNALWAIADDTFFDEIVELVTDRKYGRARQMPVMWLGKSKNPKAVDVLIGLLGDEDVTVHALSSLKRLKPKRARAAIEPLLDHPTKWWRDEAKKTIDRIDKAGK